MNTNITDSYTTETHQDIVYTNLIQNTIINLKTNTKMTTMKNHICFK